MAAKVYKEWGQFGVATTFYIAFEDPADADDLYTGTAFAAGDAKISIDGAAVVNATNLPAIVTAGQPIYSIAVSAAQMSGTRILLTVRDQTEPEVFSPVILQIQTRVALGSWTVDATQIGGNVNAMLLQGVGTGQGMRAVGGNGVPAVNGESCGITCVGGTAGGVGFDARAGTGSNGNGIASTGDGSGNAITLIAGATGEGLGIVAGSTSGNGIEVSTTNGDAILLTPAGTGKVTVNESSKGIFGVVRAQTIASATANTAVLDGAASATDDFYNEHALGIVAGTGGSPPQWRMITDYTGASKTCAVNRAWTTVPNGTSSYVIRAAADVWDQLEGTEPSGSYASGTGNFRRIMQYLLRRFYNKVTQTVSEQKVHKDDSATVLTTMAVSDDGTTQSKGKSS